MAIGESLNAARKQAWDSICSGANVLRTDADMRVPGSDSDRMRAGYNVCLNAIVGLGILYKTQHSRKPINLLGYALLVLATVQLHYLINNVDREDRYARFGDTLHLGEKFFEGVRWVCAALKSRMNGEQDQKKQQLSASPDSGWSLNSVVSALRSSTSPADPDKK